MTNYPNWFINGGAQHNFEKYLLPYQGQEVSFLQIGAYTGDATEWLFANVLTNPSSTLTDVDTWEGSDEPAHEQLDWLNVEGTYDLRTLNFQNEKRLIKNKMMSDNFFTNDDKKYDFIYIDGDHKASSVLQDGINAIARIKPGGIIAFDDYQWSLGKGPAFDPKPAIDAIRLCYSDSLTVFDLGLQAWMTKH
jgi:predicted O-methyltransferase YrrM